MIDFKRIKYIMEAARNKHFALKGLPTMDGIFYMNGNDGTSFDYVCNGRLCEFYIFSPDGDGLIKLFARDNNTYSMYIYDYDDPYNGKYQLEEGELYIDVYSLACHLQAEKDDQDIYDEVITSWELSKSTYIDVGDEDDDEY